MKTTATAHSYVRFSTPAQQWGDSERRQLTLAKDFCSSGRSVLAIGTNIIMPRTEIEATLADVKEHQTHCETTLEALRARITAVEIDSTRHGHQP